MSDDADDIAILYEEFAPLVPGTPAFVGQQIHLLENLQINRSYIPVDYKSFLECVKSLRTSYQPAVVLSAWNLLLERHLSSFGLEEDQSNNTTCASAKIVDKPLIDKIHTNKFNKKKTGLNGSDTGETSKNLKNNAKVKHKLTKPNTVKCFKNDCNENYSNPNLKSEKKTLKCTASSTHSENSKICKDNSKTLTDNFNILENLKPDLSVFLTDGRRRIKKREKDHLITSESPDRSINLQHSNSQPEITSEQKKKENSETRFIKESVSCPEIGNEEKWSLSSYFNNSYEVKETKKKKKPSSKRKSKEPYKKDVKCSNSVTKKKRPKRFSLENLCSSVLYDSSEKRSKSKIHIDQSDLDSCGISKPEFIKFLKEQKKEQIAEDKKLQTQILELYHERLVDVIIPEFYSPNTSK